MNEQLDFAPKSQTADSVETFLHAAMDSFKNHEMILTEVRLRLALKQADLTYGHNSPSVQHVLSIMAEFYRLQSRDAEMSAVEKRLRLISPDHTASEAARTPEPNQLKGLLGRKRMDRQPYQRKLTAAQVPAEVRRSCQILGLEISDLNQQAVHRAWKTSMCTDVHPDLGGEVETAILVNTARDTLNKWLDQREPNLAKRFQHIVNNHIV